MLTSDRQNRNNIICVCVCVCDVISAQLHMSGGGLSEVGCGGGGPSSNGGASTINTRPQRNIDGIRAEVHSCDRDDVRVT